MITKKARLLAHDFPVYSLDHQVVSCEEAAVAKHIPLANELKSLVIFTSGGLVVAHIPGNKKLNLRAVKRFLSSDEACLASLSVLGDLGVQPGTVSPFVSAVWDLRQLVSVDVLAFDFVSTNHGALNEYVIFPPAWLLSNSKACTGFFSSGEELL